MKTSYLKLLLVQSKFKWISKMSAVAVQEFLEKVNTDESLAQELVKALESENDRESVTELAVSKGYDITSEELWTEVKKRQDEFSQRQDAGELSDEELEAVAGGATPISVIVATQVGLFLFAISGPTIVQSIKW